MAQRDLPLIPYGAVYFRKSNPPRESWENDYRTASEDGMNIFRHWFMWSAIEVAPGVFDWSDYDRQLDLAAREGIQTIIAEMITAAPEWAFRQFAHGRYIHRKGYPIRSSMSGSCATGGFPGLCLDNDDVRKAAGRFLKALASRYKDHPGMAGYDIWNECNVPWDLCYCEATKRKFRKWLQRKYADLGTLREVWYRHSLSDWDDIEPPRSVEPYPDTLDWLQFRIDNAYDLMRWRVNCIREVDPDNLISAHGVAGTLTIMGPGAADDWKAASEVELYGFTWVASRQGDEAWKHWQAVDLTRAGSRGKDFWHAEAQAGPLWMQPQVIGRTREDGRITCAEDVRLWNMVSLAGGARGILYPRWRPLLDGPLFGAFGAYGMDGSRTDRSRMASQIAKWANSPKQRDVWNARPIRGDIGIVIIPESQIYCYAQQGRTDYYTQSLRGAYQGFFASNIQPDWVRLDHIDEYEILYLPFPYMMNQATAECLKRWVSNGGILVSEGCPGYFGDRGRVGEKQPNLGLDELFGATEAYVEFTPDLLADLRVNISGIPTWGGLFLQAYEPTSGEAVGWYSDGKVAVVDNCYGRGRTRLIGTFPGMGQWSHPDNGNQAFFADILKWAGKTQQVSCSDPRVTVRLHSGEGGTYIWATNPTYKRLKVHVRLSKEWGPFERSALHWGVSEPEAHGRLIVLTVDARDAVGARLL
jgi:beta-galactosidase